MREQITMYRDMYEFYKDTKSKRLFVAFAGYLFEGIEPTDLKGIEKTIFNSLKIRMKNQRKKASSGAIGGTSSHGGGRPRNTSSELKEETSKKQTEKQTNEQAKNKEDNNTNVLLLSRLLSKDNNVDESTEQKIDNEILYLSYPFKDKGIDKQVCDKLIDKQLQQGATREGMLKEMKLEQLELRVKQGNSHRYGKKLERRLREYVEGMADSEDRLRELLSCHRKRLENGPSYRKNPRDELCELFGKDYVNKLFMETKQGIRLFTT